MARLFRQIREQNLSEKNFIKYLLYVLGEIFIVVVGVLFALYLNNLNGQRKVNDRTVEILKDVQNDLAKNIQNADETIRYYKQKKSIIDLQLNNKLSYEDYKHNPAASRYLIMTAHHIKIYDNGYKNLMQYSNDMPDKYRPIINPLYEIYVYNKYEVDLFDEKMDKITDDYNHILMTKFDWYYSEVSSITISNKMIDYFSTPEYKNLAIRYLFGSWTGVSKHLSRFRFNAVDAYLKIAKLIGDEDVVPKYVVHNFIKVDSTILKQYTGTYKLMPAESDNISSSESKLKISMKGDHLLVSDASDTTGTGTEIYFRSVDECYDNSNYLLEYYFARNKDSAVSGFTRKVYFTLTAGYPNQYKKIE